MGADDVRGEVWSDVVEKTRPDGRGVVSKGEVLESIVGILLVYAGDLGLLCEEGLVYAVDKSGVVLTCATGLIQSAGSEERTREVELSAGDTASVAESFGACFVQDCKAVLCFENVSAVGEDDWAAVA